MAFLHKNPRFTHGLASLSSADAEFYHVSRYPSPKKDRFTSIQDKNQIRLDTQTKCLLVLMGKKSIHSTLILMIS